MLHGLEVANLVAIAETESVGVCKSRDNCVKQAGFWSEFHDFSFGCDAHVGKNHENRQRRMRSPAMHKRRGRFMKIKDCA